MLQPQVEAAQSRRLRSLEETVMLRDRKIAELQAQARTARGGDARGSPRRFFLFLPSAKLT